MDDGTDTNFFSPYFWEFTDAKDPGMTKKQDAHLRGQLTLSCKAKTNWEGIIQPNGVSPFHHYPTDVFL